MSVHVEIHDGHIFLRANISATFKYSMKEFQNTLSNILQTIFIIFVTSPIFMKNKTKRHEKISIVRILFERFFQFFLYGKSGYDVLFHDKNLPGKQTVVNVSQLNLVQG